MAVCLAISMPAAAQNMTKSVSTRIAMYQTHLFDHRSDHFSCFFLAQNPIHICEHAGKELPEA